MASLQARWASAVLGFAAIVSCTVQAQTWPPAQVRIVVPYPPGSEPDVLAREVSNRLSQQTGSTFVIENRAGANGIIGTTAVAKATGDGATLLLVDRLALVTNPMLYSNVPYDWRHDIKPVGEVGRVDLYLAVKSSFPATTYADFISLAKSKSGQITVATGGNGHVNHLGMEKLALAEGISFTYVPYKGMVPAVLAVIAGEVDAVMSGGFVVAPHQQVGAIKVLASGSETRSELLPQVPTITQAGGKPNSIPSTIFILAAPGKTPDALVDTINQAFNTVLADPALQSSYRKRGIELQRSTPAATLAHMQAESGTYEKLIKSAGVKLQ